jgi:glycosyltransferase involved in cell wall biosynthesis
MKIAIVHDYLCGIGGSERVFQYICEEFQEADIYTLSYNSALTYPYFKSRRIHTTWMNRFVRTMDAFRWLFPFATYAMQRLDLSKYDVVLSSSATSAKYIRAPNGIHICYCYIPTRAIWQFDEYFLPSWKSRFISLFMPYLRKRDYSAAQDVDYFIAISEATKKYISDSYNKDSSVIYSPINLESFRPSSEKQDYFLIVSRLEQWKRVDYAIEAFNYLGLPLRIIGTGVEEARFREMANSNIKFLGAVDDETLAGEYSRARAVIFTPYLEYGLIPLEASASGTPVICYGKGGITETMIPWSANDKNQDYSTAIFFYEQTSDALVAAIKEFEKVTFNPAQLVNHASRWGVPEFRRQLREMVTKLVSDQ